MASRGFTVFHDGCCLKNSFADTTYCRFDIAATPASAWSLKIPANPPGATSTWAIDTAGNVSYQPLSGGGTVTSVALTLPSIFSLTGSPVTTAGTLAASLASQSANTVFAAPDGSAGTPTFRALSVVDIPGLTSAKITNFDAQVKTSRLDQMAAPAAAVNLNSQKITGLAEPTAPQDAATKNYVDAAIVGSIVYKGVVNASAASAVAAGAAATPQPGWQYKVTTAGDTAFGVQLNVGDFVTWNGTSWDKTDNTDPAVVGTANRVTATPTGDTSYTVDIASNYVGQASITTVGTITAGVWDGTDVAIAAGGTGANTAAGARTNLGAAGVNNGTFTSATLVAGILTITHTLGNQWPLCVIHDNNNKRIYPDDETATSTTVYTVDLTTYGSITGTWRHTLVG